MLTTTTMTMQCFEKVPGTVPRGRYSHLSALWRFFCRFHGNDLPPVLIGYREARAVKSVIAGSLGDRSNFTPLTKKVRALDSEN